MFEESLMILRAQNSLFNSALKQSSSIRRDLDAFAEAPANSPPALQGQGFPSALNRVLLTEQSRPDIRLHHILL